MSHSEEQVPRLVDSGPPVGLSQTFRTLTHARLELGLKGCEHSRPGTTTVRFEPDQREPAMWLANTCSYSQRRRLAEHADQRTRQRLRSRRGLSSRSLLRDGVQIDDAVLDDATRRPLQPAQPDRRSTSRTLRRPEEVLDDLKTALTAWPPHSSPKLQLQLEPTLPPR